MTAPISEFDRAYLAALKPKKDPLHWMRLARCGPGLFKDSGCGLPTRWVYMSGKVQPRWAVCPVCGREKWRYQGNDRDREPPCADCIQKATDDR